MHPTKRFITLWPVWLCIIFLFLSDVTLAQQASNISYTWLSSSSLRISWTAGSGTGETTIVVSTDDISSPPINPLSFTANSNYGAAPETAPGSGDKIVYSGSATSVDVTNISRYYLGGNWIYNIKAFSIFKIGFNFYHNTGDGSVNPRNTEGISPQPQFQPSSLAVIGYTNNSISFSWSPGSGTGRLAVIYTSPISGGPANGNNYGVNPQYGLTAISGVGYTVSSGNTNSVTVTGLSGGTGYYMQVFEYYDVSGLPRNYTLYPYATISQLTLPDAPVSSAANALGQATFDANWSAPTGTTNYYLDVSTVINFASFISGFNNKSVGNVNSYSVTGLSPATTYYYRVRAENAAGVSSYSGNGSALTVPATPTATAFTAPSQNGFTANWNGVIGATGYFMDVSTDNFSTFVSGYANKALSNVATFSVTGLSPGMTYQYRVRSQNASGSSGDSNSITNALTIPANPSISTASLLGQTSFTANWIATNGATNYFLDVSKDNLFGSFVAGYNNKSIGSVSSTLVTGLGTATTYYYQVRSSNTSGTSGSSVISSALTIPDTPTANAFSTIAQTGFSANWSGVTGATGYFLDVSADNFTTFVTSFNNASVGSVITFSVTGLLAGGIYQYRVRSQNASGVSGNSNSITNILTIPANPVASAATSIIQSSFICNWALSPGATNYFLDVSKDNFSTLLTGYSNKSVVNVNSLPITGLTSGTTYQFRVRSSNGSGTSGNSNLVSVITTPDIPTVTSATAITSTGFKANWNTVTGASSYFIDVATDAAFSSAVAGNNNLSVTTNFLDVTGLVAGTSYYYRVRSANTSSTSASSAVISMITVPNVPTGLTTNGATSSIFIASWNAVPGADSYEIDVSKDNFVTLIGSHNPASTTDAITGLSPSTVYRCRVRAVNLGGKSPNSLIAIVATLDGSGKSNVLTFGNIQSTSSIPVGTGTGKATIQASGGFGAVTVKFRVRKITEMSYTEIPLTSATSTYEAILNSSMMDELGAEYYFTGTDDFGIIESAHGFSYVSIDAASASAIPFTSNFDGTSGTYQMFSVPYMLIDKNVSSVFLAMGAPDKKKWRLFHYQSGKYIEYPDNITTVDLGKGYWFNTLDKSAIKPGAGNVAESNQSKPFSIVLEKGWNQIGNPFPFSISWTSVKAVNTVSSVNSLWTYNSGAGYVKTEGFKAWGGAFVFSDTGGTLTIPVTAKCTGCRIFSGSELSQDIDGPAWQIPITLRLNNLEQVSAVGMHPDAQISKDRFDDITVPRFIEYLEMNTNHDEFFAHHFSTDIIQSTTNASWLFTVSSSHKDGKATLTWDQSSLINDISKLLLLDVQEQVFVDMKSTSQYSFNWSEGHEFKILYGKDGEIFPGITLLGNGYPNPFSRDINIPVLLKNDQSLIQIYVYDLMGRKIKIISKPSAGAGIHTLTWDGQNEQGFPAECGLYLYQLWGDAGILSPTKRMIKH